MKVIVWLGRSLRFDVFHPHFIGDVAAARNPIASCPQVLTPVAFAQVGKETKEDGATRATLKVVRRLKPDDPDPCNDLPEKPKGMHWTTYDRLVERYEGYSEQWGLAILRRLGRWRA